MITEKITNNKTKPTSATKHINGPTLSFFKPNAKNTGAAMFLEFDRERNSISMRMVPQTGPGSEKKFDSEKRIQASLGLIDIGNILAVLDDRISGLGTKDDKGQYKGLYHENANGFSVISMFRGERGLFFGLSSKRQTAEAVRYGIALSAAEEVLLEQFLKKYLGEMFNDSGVKQVAAVRSTQAANNEPPEVGW